MSSTYGLHRLGWNSFQQLCLTISREVMGQTVKGFLDSNDGGRDGSFTGRWAPGTGQSFAGKFVIQCKFTSKADHRLSLASFKAEIPKIRKLVGRKICDIYILMTNCTLTAKQDAAISEAVLAAGVKYVEILSATWIESQIKENTRLRMMVPRLYGLGDLSQILDQRAYTQARSVLESMREDLAKVVVTETYGRAIKALNQSGFVMLIGEPAAGKTTIASMLAMAAADQWQASVLKLSNPSSVVERWNPEEPYQFFWVDDAFGVTQYESSLVTSWNHSLAQVKAMLAKGARVVMTSRDYIYNRAREELKVSAFPLLREREVVIDVHELSKDEKQQILYNHMKLGNQPIEFREEIRPHLEYVAAHPRFIPEIARRLSNPLFTRGLSITEDRLDDFIDRREQLLGEVIQNLDRDSQAALALIFMRADHLESPISLRNAEIDALVRLDSSLGRCISALEALNGSLVALVYIDGQTVWRFKHPTIGDAYAIRLAGRSDLLDIFIAGSSTENLLSQVTCGDVGIEKAVVIPKSLFVLMTERLLGFKATRRYKQGWLASWVARREVFSFLSRRCSKEFLIVYLESAPKTLEQICTPDSSLSYAPEVQLAVRLYEYGLFPELQRKAFVKAVGDSARSGEDAAALNHTGIRGLFTDEEFDNLKKDVRQDLVTKLNEIRIKAQLSHNPERDADQHMQDTMEVLDTLKSVFVHDAKVQILVSEQKRMIEAWVDEHQPQEKKVRPRMLGAVRSARKSAGTRSIFDDIAEE